MYVMKTVGDQNLDIENGSDQENDIEAGVVPAAIRRQVVIIQLNVNGQNIETFLGNLKKRIEKRTKITERTADTASAGIPIKFKLRTWEWTSSSPYLNYQKYHPNDERVTTRHNLVACYYRMGPTQVAEVFLVSNTVESLRRFDRYANAEFPIKITKRLVDCNTVSKDSSHHLIGNVFTNTRTMRNIATIDFNDIPVLLLGFTASLREHSSIHQLSPFNISAKEHVVKLRKFSVGFQTPLSVDEEVVLLDHLSKIVRGEQTYLNGNLNVIEQDVELLLDVTAVDKSVAIQLNHQLAKSIFQSIMLNTKLELTLHFPKAFVATSEITFGSDILYSNDGTPTIAEILVTLSSSRKFVTPRALTSEALWNILRKFRIHLLAYGDQTQRRNTATPALKKSAPIVDAMHGAVHYKEHTYWRFCSNWYMVSSDRLAGVQHRFRQLLKNNLMSDQDRAYLFKRFPMQTQSSNENEGESSSSNSPQPSTSTAAVNQDSQRSDGSSQKSNRDNLENDYNCSYAGEPNFLVGDKITANHIEIFDLLRYDPDGGTVWIYHVKRKFGQCTRDALSQLALSAQIIGDDIVGSGEKTLHKHFDQLAEKADINAKLIEWGVKSGGQYVSLFRNNKVVFVYAFVDEDNKSTKRSLKDELQIKETITIDDLKEKLKLYKRQISDQTNFQSIIHELYRLVIHIQDSDVDNLETIAKNLFDFLVKQKLIGTNGSVTGKLLYGINFNQLGNISESVQKFQDFTMRYFASVNFFEFILKPYRSLYQTLIAKIELQRVHRFISDRGFDFQICEIERENGNGSAPATPVSNVPMKRDSSGSGSSRKRPKTSSTKKAVPKGQPLIDKFLNVARNLSKDLNKS